MPYIEYSNLLPHFAPLALFVQQIFHAIPMIVQLVQSALDQPRTAREVARVQKRSFIFGVKSPHINQRPIRVRNIELFAVDENFDNQTKGFFDRAIEQMIFFFG